MEEVFLKVESHEVKSGARKLKADWTCEISPNIVKHNEAFRSFSDTLIESALTRLPTRIKRKKERKMTAKEINQFVMSQAFDALLKGQELYVVNSLPKEGLL